MATEEEMIYITFKKIVEQFIFLYEKANTDKITKIKKMLPYF